MCSVRRVSFASPRLTRSGLVDSPSETKLFTNHGPIADCFTETRRGRPHRGRPSLDLSHRNSPAHAPVADGALVQVKDHRQRLIGTGFFNSKSKINVRVLSPERVEVNEHFFEERIRAALAVRQRHLPDATSFRVVNAESDFLSGLIVDKYEDVLVVQISSLGMDQRKAQIVAALQKIFSPRAILERSDVASRKFEGLAESERRVGRRIQRAHFSEFERIEV